MCVPPSRTSRQYYLQFKKNGSCFLSTQSKRNMHCAAQHLGTDGRGSLKIKYIHLPATLFSSGRQANDLDKALRSGIRHFHGQLSVTLLLPPLLSQSLTGELKQTVRHRTTMFFPKTVVFSFSILVFVAEQAKHSCTLLI